MKHKRVFISYTHSDLEHSELIAHQLRERGVDVLLDTYRQAPGQDFVQSISHAMAEFSAALVLLSTAYTRNSFVRSEWLSLSQCGTPVIPVKLDSCAIEEYIGPTVYVDLTDLDHKEWGAVVFNALSRAPTHRHVSRPPFPGHAAASHDQLGGLARVAETRPAITNVSIGAHTESQARAEVLRSLHRSLTRRPAGKSEPVLLTGMTGTGKSRVAAEYARRYGADYDVVWWVRGESNTLLNDDLLDLASALGVAQEPEAVQLVAYRLRTWAESTPKQWLLVIDNAENMRRLLELLPRRGQGHVLLTAKSGDDLPASLNEFNVDVLGADAAIDLLIDRTGSTDREGAADVARLLHGQAYSLELAAAYIRVTGVSFADYLSRLAEEEQTISDEASSAELIAGPTVALSVRHASTTSNGALQLLQLLSLVDAQGIPLSAVRQVLADRDLTEGILLLARLGLLEIADDMTVEVHRIVGNHMRRNMDATETRMLLVRLVDWFSDLGSEHRSAWPYDRDGSDRLMSHCLQVIRTSMAKEIESNKLIDACHLWGRYAERRGHQRLAASFFERALALVIRTRRPYEPQVLNDAAVVFARDVYSRDISTELALEALHHCLKTEGSEPSSSLASAAMSNIAANLADAGRHDESLAQYKLAITRERNREHPDWQFLLTLTHNYATVTADLGNITEARLVLKETYRRRVLLLGPEHEYTIQSMVAFGHASSACDDPTSAIQLLGRGVILSERVLGEFHPCTISALNGLGLAYVRMGDLRAAFPYIRQALERRMDMLGPQHTDTLTSMYLLVLISRRLGDTGTSVNLLQHWLTSAVQTLGDQHPLVTHARSELALLSEELGHDDRIARIGSMLHDLDTRQD